MNFNPLNLNQWNQWLNRKQLQVLEAAYKAAQNIKALEDKYFNGGKITYAPNQTKTLVDYVESLRDRQLFIATVPVIIDSSTKFWIFNYLTKYSPASSAIYERMNT